MKTTIKIITAAFLITCLTNTASAQHLLSLEEGRQNDLLTIRLTDLDNKRTTIQIIGVAGKSWMKKHIHHQEAYVAGMDLSLLPDGDYLVTTVNQRHREIKAFNRAGKDITIFQPKRIQAPVAPHGRLVANQEARRGQLIVRVDQPETAEAIDLRLANLREKQADIHFTSLEGIPVFSEQVRDQYGYAGRLDLQSVGDGAYVLSIQTPKAALLQFITIKEGHATLDNVLSREKTSGKGVLLATRF